MKRKVLHHTAGHQGGGGELRPHVFNLVELEKQGRLGAAATLLDQHDTINFVVLANTENLLVGEQSQEHGDLTSLFGVPSMEMRHAIHIRKQDGSAREPDGKIFFLRYDQNDWNDVTYAAKLLSGLINPQKKVFVVNATDESAVEKECSLKELAAEHRGY